MTSDRPIRIKKWACQDLNPDLEVTPYHLIKRVVETEASHPIQVGPQAHREKSYIRFYKFTSGCRLCVETNTS